MVLIVKRKFFFVQMFRVSKEADLHENPQPVEIPNPDADLPQNENFFSDFMRKITGENDRLMYIYIFTAIVIATIITTFIRSFVFFSIAMRASRNLHNTMFQGNLSYPLAHIHILYVRTNIDYVFILHRCYTRPNVLFPHKSIW